MVFVGETNVGTVCECKEGVTRFPGELIFVEDGFPWNVRKVGGGLRAVGRYVRR